MLTEESRSFLVAGIQVLSFNVHALEQTLLNARNRR